MSLAGLDYDQLVEELKELGEEPQPKWTCERWTCEEIRHRIITLRSAGRWSTTHLPSRGTRPKRLARRTPLQVEISRSSKKAKIQAACELADIKVNTDDSKGSMMDKLKAKRDLDEMGSTLLGVGKYADLTYREVRDQHPGYALWALEVLALAGGGSVQLQQFSAWLERESDMLGKRSVSEMLELTSLAKSSQRLTSETQRTTQNASRPPSRESARRPEVQESDHSQETPEPTVESSEVMVRQTRLITQLASVVQQVSTRVQSLETRVDEMEENPPVHFREHVRARGSAAAETIADSSSSCSLSL